MLKENEYNDVIPARLRYAPLSAQKARLIADQIRGMKVSKALDILMMLGVKKAAGIIKKLLLSAVANAEHNNEIFDVDNLILCKIYVDEAPSYKRFRARAKGRGNRIVKRNCHITLMVADMGY